MKSKTWAILIGAVLVVCLAIGGWLRWAKQDAAYAEVWSNGTLLYTMDLSVNQQFTVSTPLGTNTIMVRDGKIAVTAADCPDGYCKDRGFCAGGLQIVCLPNKLEIRFVGETEVDGVVG